MGETKRAGENYEGREKEKEACSSNILAARGVSDFIRTSLGPRGMDKMITTENKEVVITNDGATILKNLDVLHPVANMLIELSKSQDVEAGDGTTSVVILAGALLEQSQILIDKGIHPNIISECFRRCAERAPEILKAISSPVSLDSDEVLTNAAVTSLSSKIVSPEAPLLAPIAVKAVKMVLESSLPGNLDLRNVRVVTKLGGTIDESKLVNGIVFDQKASHSAGGPTKIKQAKIALIQFQLSAPKTDMDFSLLVRRNEEIDRINKDERAYVARIVTKISKTGCNVLLVQKSIIRDAVSTLSLHFLAKRKIMVVTNVERDDVEFISKALGCKPIASIDDFSAEKLGQAEWAEEQKTQEGGSLIFVEGVKNPGKAVSVLLRGSNRLVLAEAERSFHDALCVVRCLVKSPFTLPGGAAAEMELSVKLRDYALTLGGADAMCVRAFAEAMETIPFTLAENCGLNPIKIVTELRDCHVNGQSKTGIDVRRGRISDIEAMRVIQPALVTLCAVALSTECVQMILKIDGIVQTSPK